MQNILILSLLCTLSGCISSPVVVKKVYEPKKMVVVSYSNIGFESMVADARKLAIQKATDFCESEPTIVSEELKSEVDGISTNTFDNSVRVDRNQNIYLTFSCSK